MPGDFNVTSEPADKGTVVVHVTGHIDAHTVKPLQSAIVEHFSQGNHKLIFDLSNVAYMSSAGASLFIVANTDAKDKQGNVVLMNVQPDVRQIFELLGIAPQFLFVKNKAAALAAFQ